MTRSFQLRQPRWKVAAVLAAGATLGLGVAPAVAGAATAGPSAPAATSSTGNRVGYQAEAFGTSITGSKELASGPTALAGIGCTSMAGVTSTNTAAAAAIAVGTIGALSDNASSSLSGRTHAAVASSTIASINIAGMIEASGVAVSSQTSETSGVYSTQGSTDFTDLVVAGTDMPESPAANTSMTVPGLGTLVLNQQITSPTPSGGMSLTVRALDLRVSASNTAGLPAGLQVVIGDAHSALTGPVVSILSGQAFASRVKAPDLSAGESALSILSCQGTGGKVQTNSTLSIGAPGVATSGTATSTAEGTIDGKSAAGQTTDTIQNLDLLGGIVTASSVKASASLTKTKGQPLALSDQGSAFTGLSVAGMPGITDAVPPNTVVPIPGLGTLYLHRVEQTPNGITVHMVELVLSVSAGGAAAGTDVVLGSASVHLS